MEFKIIFNFIFLPIIVFIGIVTSFEDYKSSKIRNKWVLVGLIYAAIIYLLAWLIYYLTGKQDLGLVASFIWNFDKWCINLTISITVAYLLWHFKMWGAGDAKLFIAYAALIPMGQYSKVYFNYYFASFLLLLSIFVPATVFLFLRAMLYFLKRLNFAKARDSLTNLQEVKINKPKIFELVKVLFGFFVFFLFFIMLRQEFVSLVGRLLPNRNILMLITLLAFRPLSKIFKKKSKLVLLFFTAFVLYIIFKIQSSGGQYLILTVSALKRSVMIMLLFPIITKIIHIYEENTTRKTIPFAIWMFLGALITWFI